jgi:hypothetical protein
MTEIIPPVSTELLEASFDDDGENFNQVFYEADNSWRHGCYITAVFERLSDHTFWEVFYRVSTDGETNELRDEILPVKRVYPKEITSIIYTNSPN